MSLVKNVLLQRRSPLIHLIRLRGKINIQRPRKPHYDRQLMNAVTQPFYPQNMNIKQNCFETPPWKNLQIENPYNRVIAREVLNWLDHSKMTAVFHMNSIKSDDFFKARVAFHKQNMYLKSYGKRIIQMAVEKTRYEAIIPLFDSNHCIVFSPEQDVRMLLRTAKKISQMILIAGIVDDKLMNRNEILKYSQVSNIQVARSQFVSVLSMAGRSIVQNLEAHQNAFVNVLDVNVKINKEDESITLNEDRGK